MSLPCSSNNHNECLFNNQVNGEITINDKSKNNLNQDVHQIILDSFNSSQHCFNVLSITDEKIVIEMNLNKNDSQNLFKKSKLLQNSKIKIELDKSVANFNQNYNCNDKKNETLIEDNDSSEYKFIYRRANRFHNRQIVSECAEKSLPMRGILKYPRGWRRTLSESNCDDYEYYIDPDLSKSLSDLSLDYDSENVSIERPKKSVRFNNFVSRAIFRQNSVVSKKRNKNRKKSEKKDQAMMKTMTNLKSDKSKSVKVPEVFSEKQNGSNKDNFEGSENEKKTQNRSRQDSGYDSEENSKVSKNVINKVDQSLNWEQKKRFKK